MKYAAEMSKPDITGGRKVSKKKKILVVVAACIIVAVGILAGWLMIRAKKQTKSKPQTTMQTAVVKKMDLSNSISVTGTIASADCRSVSADVSGVEVEAVRAQEGDYVNAGDTIIVLSDSSLEDELESAQDSYSLEVTKTNKNVQDAADSVTDAQDAYSEGVSDQQALVADSLSVYNGASATEAEKKEAYEKAQKETEKAKEAYEKKKEEKSDLKKALDKAEKELKEAEEDYKKAKEAYEAAQATAKDENGNIDAAIYQTYTDASAAQEAAKAEYDQAKKAYDGIEEAKTAYSDAKKAQEEAKEAYEAAIKESEEKYAAYEKALKTQSDTNEKNADSIDESKYQYAITSQEAANNLKNQKKQVQEIEEKLGECVVTAPISGVITSVGVEDGDTYEGGTLFVIQDMTSFLVEATVDEYDISDIEKDMEAVVKTDATGEEELTGVVTYVAPTPVGGSSSDGSGNAGQSASSGSAEYEIQIALSAANERLRIGMTAKTGILMQSVKDVLAVPYDCICTDEEGNTYVEAMKTAGSGQEQTTKINVETGLESDYYVEVSGEGLSEGMVVLVPGQETSEETQDTGKSGNDNTADSLINGLTGQNKGSGRSAGGGPGRNGGAPGGF